MINKARTIALASMALFAPALALCQPDCVTAAGRPCSPQDAQRMRDAVCKTETAPPNLYVAAPAKIGGTLLDESGAPVVFGDRTIVQVRNAESGKVLHSASVNHRGQFDLGTVTAGTFRLIVAIQVHGGVLVRPPSVDQPPRIDCSGGECNLRVILHKQDSADSFLSCPPK